MKKLLLCLFCICSTLIICAHDYDMKVYEQAVADYKHDLEYEGWCKIAALVDQMDEETRKKNLDLLFAEVIFTDPEMFLYFDVEVLEDTVQRERKHLDFIMKYCEKNSRTHFAAALRDHMYQSFETWIQTNKGKLQQYVGKINEERVRFLKTLYPGEEKYDFLLYLKFVRQLSNKETSLALMKEMTEKFIPEKFPLLAYPIKGYDYSFFDYGFHFCIHVEDTLGKRHEVVFVQEFSKQDADTLRAMIEEVDRGGNEAMMYAKFLGVPLDEARKIVANEFEYYSNPAHQKQFIAMLPILVESSDDLDLEMGFGELRSIQFEENREKKKGYAWITYVDRFGIEKRTKISWKMQQS